MHELSIALSLLEVAEEEAERRSLPPVLAIHLKVGPLSGVIAEALVSAYELAREGTPFEKARLVIEEVPVRVHCPVCDGERAAGTFPHQVCGECGTPAARIVSGKELEITALEVAS